VEHVVGGAGARRDNQSRDAEVGITLDEIAVEFGLGRDTHFDFIKRTPAPGAGSAEAGAMRR